MDQQQRALNRRRFIECLSAAGVGSTLLPGALAAVAQDAETITIEMLRSAQQIAGVSFTPDEQRRLLEKLNGPRGYAAGFARLRATDLGDTPPAFVFNPVLPGKQLPTERRPMRRQQVDAAPPRSDEELAFLPVTRLSRLVEMRQITSTDLTKLYLARLKKYDAQLHCTVSLTEELALRQAKQADEEIAAGRYRGPLHGIPWGVKDLLAVRGTRTTWGMSPFRERVIDADATVYSRLTQAGAVLVAKLSTGALAVTAQWFGGVTRNPWNTSQDASGSSAGPGSATAAGLVGFSIGTDTGGSIIQPATRNGASGLRPTFGRVSRYGAMTLAWTQDTIGPICRSAEDCALVFDAIHGPDGKDNSVLDVPFNFDALADVSRLRVGHLRPSTENGRDDETRRNDEEALRVIRSLGVTVVPFALPDVPIEAIDFIRYAETAAAFDAVTRAGVLPEVEHGPEQSRRPDEIRAAYFIPAVDFIQAARMRMRVMQQVDAALGDLDLFIGSNQLLTNRTGQPVLSVPNGFANGSPTALHLTGKLFGEPEILLLAHAFQATTDFHLRRPPL
ncbi:MAG TPA: amidase [Vicinamibacterales bacterium]|nr:amidase [Vicinamibacterales bacterium]